MTTILVTGGAGYIGAHTCKALAQSGYTPVTFDNLSTGHVSFIRWGPFVRGDIRDTTTVLRVIRDIKPEAVLHFAASAYVGESVVDPQKYYENNVAGTLSLLRAMLDGNCQNIVFSSTCAIYGEPQTVPMNETTSPHPVNPYGASKFAVERILADYALAYPLRAVALRYFNASGADPDGEIGELREPETHLIPRALMAIQGHITDFAVFGTDYATPDGTAIRDYIHVADLADAHVAATQRLVDGGPGGAFNLGTGHGYSVKQVLDAIAAETGVFLEAAPGARREGDPPTLVADAALARAELGFTPKLSNMTSIVKTAWAWHQRAHPKRPSHAQTEEARPVGP